MQGSAVQFYVQFAVYYTHYTLPAFLTVCSAVPKSCGKKLKCSEAAAEETVWAGLESEVGGSLGAAVAGGHVCLPLDTVCLAIVTLCLNP